MSRYAQPSISPRVSAVFHIVPVDDIVITVNFTFCVHKRRTGSADFALKGQAQVFFRIVRGMHHRVVQNGVLNTDPAEQVRVLLIHRSVLRQDFRLCFYFRRIACGVGRDNRNSWNIIRSAAFLCMNTF